MIVMSKFYCYQPNCDELGSVFHKKANLVAMLETVLIEYIGDSILKVIDLRMI